MKDDFFGWIDPEEFPDQWMKDEGNLEFLAACRNGNPAFLEDALACGRDPNLPVAGKSPLWHARSWSACVKLLCEYGADPLCSGLWLHCQRFFRDDLIKIMAPFFDDSFSSSANCRGEGGAGDWRERTLLLAQKELDRRCALFHETGNRNFMEYNQEFSPERKLKKRFVTIPYIDCLPGLAMYAAARVLHSGIPAGIEIAIGSVRKTLGAEFRSLCVEVTPPPGTSLRLHWFAAQQSFYNQKAGRK